MILAKITSIMESICFITPLFIMCVGLLMMFGSYDGFKIKELFVNIGWVFLLGGETYLGISIIEYYFNRKTTQHFNTEVMQK